LFFVGSANTSFIVLHSAFASTRKDNAAPALAQRLPSTKSNSPEQRSNANEFGFAWGDRGLFLEEIGSGYSTLKPEEMNQ
jgi:hypothetical protein